MCDLLLVGLMEVVILSFGLMLLSNDSRVSCPDLLRGGLWLVCGRGVFKHLGFEGMNKESSCKRKLRV